MEIQCVPNKKKQWHTDEHVTLDCRHSLRHLGEGGIKVLGLCGQISSFLFIQFHAKRINPKLSRRHFSLWNLL